MLAAIFGLVGVFVGGVVTTASDRYIARRRAEAELAMAARILMEDLTWFASAAMLALNEQSWSPILRARLHTGRDPFAIWEGTRASFGTISLADWHSIAAGVRHAEMLHTWAAEARDSEDFGGRADAVANALTTLNAAVVVLRPLTTAAPRVGLPGRRSDRGRARQDAVRTTEPQES